MLLPNRHESSNEYRYAFNGMETDKEVSGTGNSYTTQFRQYDPRLGRWKSRDPLEAKYASMSPYIGMGNNPNFYTDPLGLEPKGGGEKGQRESKNKISDNTKLEGKKEGVKNKKTNPWTLRLGRLHITFRVGKRAKATGFFKFGVSWKLHPKAVITKVKVVRKTKVRNSPPTTIMPPSRSNNSNFISPPIPIVPNSSTSVKFEPFGIPDQIIVTDLNTGRIIFNSGSTNTPQNFTVPAGVTTIQINVIGSGTNSFYTVEIVNNAKIRFVETKTITKVTGQKRVKTKTVSPVTVIPASSRNFTARKKIKTRTVN